MTAQRSSSPLFGSQGRTAGTRLPSRFNVAVSTAALPAVLLSGVALAQPANAAPTAVKSQQTPRLAAAVTVPAGVTIPVSAIPAQIPAFMSPAQVERATHTVQAGETISGIAAQHGLDTAAVLEANGLSDNTLIHPGQKIALSSSPSAEPAAEQTEQSAGAEYTVQNGDTLSAIAAAHGLSLGTVLQANSLSMTSVIHPGQKISLSGSAEVSVASTQIAPSVAEVTPIEEAPTDLVPSTFLHYTYPDDVVADANLNKQTLNSLPAPSTEEMKAIVADTARAMGVDPTLALAVSFQESGFNQRAVSPANAIGAMQVIPMSGDWASDLVGRQLNLLDPYDNATAGVAILQSLVRTSANLEEAIASYYQGQYSVTTHGMFSDTQNYVAAINAHQASFR